MRDFNSLKVPVPNLDFNLKSLTSHTKLDVEIGAGQGLNAISYCSQNPNNHLIAIEKTHVRFEKLLRRSQNHPQLQNLTCIQADAVSFITHFLPSGSVNQVFILYPNPYPKNSQSNLRWHNRPFFQTLKDRMKPGGDLTLATNIEAYKIEAIEHLQNRWQMILVSSDEISLDQNPRTHFEKKYLERGERCWNLIFRKPL